MKRRPSATAGLVARGVAFQASHPLYGSLVPADAAALAARLAAASGHRMRRGDSRIDRWLVRVQERLVVPGLTLQYVLRKRRIEQHVRTALAEGFRQLVVVGAGFDTLAHRLSGSVRAIEIDRPETQSVKRAALGETAVMFLAADLAHDSLATVLNNVSAVPTIFLIEAVFLYVPADDVHRTLRDIRSSSPKARVIFTFFGPRKNFTDATFIADLWLKSKGERVLWAIDPGDIRDFVAADGFEMVELIRDDDYHQGLPAARGEHIAVVEAR